MDKFENFCNSVVEEVFQKHAIQRKIILKVLHSKRLLSDHIDVLEIAFGDVQNKTIEPTRLFNFSQTMFLMAISAITKHLTNCWKYIVPALSIGYTSIYGIKLFHQLKNKILLDRLKSLVSLIDQYELCIKRNLIFFNEINVMKSGMDSSVQCSSKIEREREVVYIESIKKISTTLYNRLTEMENQFKMPDKYETIYENLENLLSCDYFKNTFTKLSSRDAKAFYNIFAFTQSQYLLRFGMTAGYHPITHLILSDFRIVSRDLRSEIQSYSNLFVRLTEIDEQISKTKLNSERKIKSELSSIGLSNATEIANLKNFSLICSSKLMMLANECRHFDDEFQFSIEGKTEYTKEFFLKLYERMKMLETNFNLCHDEYQRFILTYNKYVNDKYKLDIGLSDCSETIKNIIPDSRVDNELTRIISEQTHNLIEDDFFAIDMMNEASLNRNHSIDMSLDDELVTMNNRLIKTKFKPVLTQLKEIIEPINEKMKIKEKQVLASKGIIVDDSENHISKDVQPDSSDTDSDDFEKKAVKKSKSYNKYNESREFLASKPVNLLPNLLALTNNNAVNNNIEDIIE